MKRSRGNPFRPYQTKNSILPPLKVKSQSARFCTRIHHSPCLLQPIGPTVYSRPLRSDPTPLPPDWLQKCTHQNLVRCRIGGFRLHLIYYPILLLDLCLFGISRNTITKYQYQRLTVGRRFTQLESPESCLHATP